MNNDLFITKTAGMFVTCILGEYNLITDEIRWVNGGHQPALIIHEDGSYELLSTDGIFLGMYPDEVYKENTKNLISGDRIILFTDGIIESINKKNEIYGISRLKDIVLKYKNLDINDILEKLYQDLDLFRDKREARDDQTAIIIEVLKNVD